MFDDNLHRLNSYRETHQPHGGSAPSRRALNRQSYVKEKTRRLQAESSQRRRAANNRIAAAATAWLRQAVFEQRALIRAAMAQLRTLNKLKGESGRHLG